jgi:demethylmenaquinone methyltransferase/2-methoxy-6-polyprenyl-1,4-benzoquinol methylase
MFDRIAPRYDRMNRLLTGRLDQRWRRDLVRALRVGRSDTVLDLACGTGDFAELCRALGATVIGLDFSRGMLAAARSRLGAQVDLVQGDALRLPLADASVDVAVSGFALRNFAALPPVFAELARVLRPGGRLGLLEVDRPRNAVVRAGHSLYFDRAVPLLGRLLADGAAYSYLPKSTVYLPPEPELLAMLEGVGFTGVRKQKVLLGAGQVIMANRP